MTMIDKLDLLEQALRVSSETSQAVRETTIDRRRHDRRINIERRWQGQLRWVYITAVAEPGLPDYGLFLGWSSDSPGQTFWEGRSLGDLAHAEELVSQWVLHGASPETLFPGR
jgi:hypothetical protein